MLVSVVINTYNRVATLEQTLDALRGQSYTEFEVVVVNGPSTDDTAALLAARAREVRVVDCPERRLSQSRNLGIDAAAGEIVAFIDDDAIPEPDWLAELVAAYADADVAGAGGVVLDHAGVLPQYRFSACDRVARPNYDLASPDTALTEPGADPFLYLQGTNMSFRRAALEDIGGFDEEIEYNYDEADVCLRLIDAGHRLVALDGARVHHKVAASHLRRAPGITLDPYLEIKNRAYFAVRHGRPARALDEIVAIVGRHVEHVRATAREQAELGHISRAELAHLLVRLTDGFELGVARGLEAAPQGRPIEPRAAEAFRPYPVHRPQGRRLRIAFVAFDYPPPRGGGIARFTQDLAGGLAAEGHEVHVLTHDAGPDRVEFEGGAWVHTHPYSPRFVPELDGRPIGEAAKRLSWVYRAVARLHEQFPLDVVSVPQWAGDALLVAQDPRWPTVVTCMTPMRIVAATQPAVAALPESALQIRLEDAAAAAATRLHAISDAILAEVRGAAPETPADVVALGTVDRHADFPRRRGEDDSVEILFVGRLELRKGVDVLLEAATDLLRERPRARLTLIGADTGTAGEPYGARFRRDAPDLADRVRFLGEVPEAELFQAYADCDVFCAPSRYDSFGLILTEAMSFGRPVVAGRTGGMPEVVGDAGVLVDPGDADGLREALRALVDDPDRRARLGAAGRARFETEFEVGAVARRTAVAYARAARPGADVSEPEAAVRRTAATLLEELGELDPTSAARAAERLLAPTAFPVDHEARLRQAATETDDTAFVAALYPLLLGRAPDPEGLGAALERFAESGSRLAVIDTIATSDEGRARGLDAALVARARGLDPVATTAAVRAIWTSDDETFLVRLPAALNVVGPADELRAAARAALPNGRHAALAAVLTRPELARELEPATRVALSEADLFTREELDARLGEAARRGPAAFADAAYLWLLGRTAEPAALAHLLRRLEGGTAPAEILREIAGSEEARSRGLDAAWLDGIERRVPVLGPPRGLAARARRFARRHRSTPAWRVTAEGQRRALNRLTERVIRDERVGRARLEERIAALEATVQRLRAEQESDREAITAPRIFGPHARLWIDPTAIVHDALFNTVSGTISVGEHAFFGHGVAVLTGTHDIERLGAERQSAIPDAGHDIVIGAGAWVSTRALVLGPCRIGEHAVVAAGAVVTGDVPAGAVVAGVPARVVGAVETLRSSSAP